MRPSGSDSSFSFSRIISNGKILENATVITRNGLIREIKTGNSADRSDFPGLTAVPSFVDIHTHGMKGIDSANLTKDTMRDWMRALPETGVLDFVPTLVSTDRSGVKKFLETVESASETNKNGGIVANPIGARLEGPFISTAKKGAHNARYILKPTISNYEKLTENSGTVRIIDIAPELPGALNLIEKLKGMKKTVSIGHSNATYHEAESGSIAGATIATHLFNAMRPIQHREPGITGEVLLDPSIYAELINDRNHLSAEIIKLALRTKGFRKIIAITDSIAATLMPDGEYRLGDLSVSVEEGKCVIKGTKTIAGSTLTMDQALRNFVHQGIRIQDAVLFLTENPSRALGLKNQGKIETSSRCNLTLLDSDLRVKCVIADGKLKEF